ncbi:ABC transporter transmembrane domain-containing protein [Streptoalloteichus hindustanus]|uniref:ABC-type multidrug transport system, ATPase and permease component n=1 Tax=Streptoalloteichus hindustanus TaxID=2017 RepID=A0A1M5CV38_STRHI|nr:ABC transporter ATP-binding protein [Streptoalloteichus hindustanus]SHF58630.1 ABC-type multidrug transport system, ATPase and permease component [Streptoalloteichus hindustanus]
MTGTRGPESLTRSRRPLGGGRYLWLILWERPWLVAGTAITSTLWALPGALLPLVIGHGVGAIDARSWRGIWLWALVAAGLGVAQSAFSAVSDFLATGLRLHGVRRTQQLVTAQLARAGTAVRDATTVGEVVTVTSSDLEYIGNGFTVLGRVIGTAVGFVVVAVALLGSSPVLGGVALVGVPLAVLGIKPLFTPLQRRTAAQRERFAEASALGADIVSGLRILRGIGGEQRFLRRFRAASQRVRESGRPIARSEGVLSAANVALPGLVTVVIVWWGARLALDGTLDVGELVAFYAASAYLVVPVTTMTEAADALSGGLVSAHRVLAVLAVPPTRSDPPHPVPLPDGPLSLVDTESGVRVEPGLLTVIDAGEAGAPLADRLAGFADTAPGEDVLVGGVPVRQVALAELRRRVVCAHHSDIWFSGVLREQLTPAHPSLMSVSAAVFAADADDIVNALPAGLDETLGERGWELSGGQRQRLNLARALATDADVLLLDEPTSAVDAHTESRIAERVAELRRGRTTVVFSQSPLWTRWADRALSLRAAV